MSVLRIGWFCVRCGYSTTVGVPPMSFVICTYRGTPIVSDRL